MQVFDAVVFKVAWQGFFVELGVVTAVRGGAHVNKEGYAVDLQKLRELFKRARAVTDGEHRYFRLPFLAAAQQLNLHTFYAGLWYKNQALIRRDATATSQARSDAQGGGYRSCNG